MPLSFPSSAAATDYGAHAYWRILLTGGFGNDNGFTALAFKDGAGNVIATTGGSAVESDHFSTFTSANLFDSTNATFWEQDTTTIMGWAGYHFASAVTVMQVGLQKAASMDGSSVPPQVMVQYSDDGVAWKAVATLDARATLTANDTMFWFDLTPGVSHASV